MIHPKTALAAVLSSLGVVIVAVLASIHGVHLSAEANAAIPAFLGVLGAYLGPSPSNSVTPVTGNNQTFVQEPPTQS